MSLLPITFSIPKEKIINFIPDKIKMVSSLIPGKLDTYIYNNETDYYNEYLSSFFAITTKKAGWDCMRHYEIMANGCIPYFPNIENCPQNTMALLPKDLFLKGNTLYYKYKDMKLDDLSVEDKNILNGLILELLNHTKKYLTTEQVAKYVLEKTNNITVKKILYLSGNTSPDYLRCVTLHGFKEILGENCHDYPKIEHIYKTNHIDYSKLYGKGISYSNCLDDTLHNYKYDSSLDDDIKNKNYDIVIYGSLHRGTPYYELICQYYKPNEIILLCGEDEHNCVYDFFVNKGHYVFVRELK